jgi:hypothetical protein
MWTPTARGSSIKIRVVLGFGLLMLYLQHMETSDQPSSIPRQQNGPAIKIAAGCDDLQPCAVTTPLGAAKIPRTFSFERSPETRKAPSSTPHKHDMAIFKSSNCCGSTGTTSPRRCFARLRRNTSLHRPHETGQRFARLGARLD